MYGPPHGGLCLQNVWNSVIRSQESKKAQILSAKVPIKSPFEKFSASPARGSETPAAASPLSESDKESIESALAAIASGSIVPTFGHTEGFYDKKNDLIRVGVRQRKGVFVTEIIKDDRIIATFNDDELAAAKKRVHRC